MDALQEARNTMQDYSRSVERGDEEVWLLPVAQAYAAIAQAEAAREQAEQLWRIADALDKAYPYTPPTE